MPKFYFHTRRGDDLHRDADGTELATVADARLEVIQTLSDMAREEFPGDGDNQSITVDVVDADGRCVIRASISLHLDQMAGSDRS